MKTLKQKLAILLSVSMILTGIMPAYAMHTDGEMQSEASVIEDAAIEDAGNGEAVSGEIVSEEAVEITEEVAGITEAEELSDVEETTEIEENAYTDENFEVIGTESDEDSADIAEELLGSSNTETVNYIDENGEMQSHECIMVGAGSSYTFRNGGWYAVDGEITIEGRINNDAVSVNPAHLILMEGCKFNVPKGIANLSGRKLIIYGQSEYVESAGEGNTTGKLIIKAAEKDDAGIGGNRNRSSGELAVCGGQISIVQGGLGAGIGGGSGVEPCSGGLLNVYGGYIDVVAKGRGAGVGGAGMSETEGDKGGSGGTVNVFGGILKVKSTETGTGAAIGGGEHENWKGGDGGSLNVFGGKVYAECTHGGSAAIGGAASHVLDPSNGGTVTVAGGELIAYSREHRGIGGGRNRTGKSAGGVELTVIPNALVEIGDNETAAKSSTIDDYKKSPKPYIHIKATEHVRVTFDTMGGSSVAPLSVEKGTKISAPVNPSRVGYEFADWYSDSAYTQKWNFEENTVNSNTTLFAKWNKKSYTITWIGKSSSAEELRKTSTTEHGEIPKCEDEDDFNHWNGYYHVGWTPEVETAKKDATYTAVYVPIPETKKIVVFDYQNGLPSTVVEVVEGGIVEKPASPSRAGYGFEGWYLKNGEAYNFTSPVNENIILVAKWNKNIYPVTWQYYSAELKKDTETTSNYHYNDIPACPVSEEQMQKPGATFTGWTPEIAAVTEATTYRAEYENFSLPVYWKIDAEGKLTIASASFGEAGKYAGCFDGSNSILSAEDSWLYYSDEIKTAIVEGSVKTTHPECWFIRCDKITAINLDGLDATGAESMDEMFYGCESLTSISFGDAFDTNSVSSMDYMFAFCTSAKSLDISGFSTAALANAKGMFYGCSELTTIYASTAPEASFSNVSGYDMFKDCNRLVGGNGTTYDEGVVNSFYARIDSDNAPGYFTKSGEQTKRIVSFVTGCEIEVPNQKVKCGECASAPVMPQREGYTFNGWWYIEAQGMFRYDFNTPVFENITLYADWEYANYFVVEFDTRGGSYIGYQLIEKGETAVEPASPEKAGNEFEGWYTDEDCQNKFSFTTPIMSDTKVYANWTEIAKPEWRITWKYGNPASKLSTTSMVTDGVVPKFPGSPSELDYEGHEFICWLENGGENQGIVPAVKNTTYIAYYNDELNKYNYVVYDGKGGTVAKVFDMVPKASPATISAPEDPVREGYTFLGWFDVTTQGAETAPFNFSETEISKDYLLEAHWEQINCVITWKKDGAVIATESFAYGDMPEFPSGKRDKLDKAGYIFDGWNPEMTVAKKDTTYTAKYQPRPKDMVRVFFDLDGGSGNINQIIPIKKGSKIAAPDSIPVREGYEFVYWYKAGESDKFDFSNSSITEDTIIRAMWKLIPVPPKATYTIKWVNYDGSVLKTAKLEEGSLPDYGDTNPSRSGYIFTGWSPKIALVTGDATYKATYEAKSSSGGGGGGGGSSSNKTSAPAGSIEGTWTYHAVTNTWTFNANGIDYANCWAYVFNPNATGNQPAASWFYFDVNGIMLTGWQWIKGSDGITRCYYLNPIPDNTLGACIMGPGTTPDGFTVDANGAWTVNGVVQTR